MSMYAQLRNKTFGNRIIADNFYHRSYAFHQCKWLVMPGESRLYVMSASMLVIFICVGQWVREMSSIGILFVICLSVVSFLILRIQNVMFLFGHFEQVHATMPFASVMYYVAAILVAG